MSVQDQYINSVNLNLHTEFPYLVLNVEDDVSYPLNPGFRVMHWHEDLQFIYVIKGTICVKTLDEEDIISAGEGVFINKNLVHMVENGFLQIYELCVSGLFCLILFRGSGSPAHSEYYREHGDIPGRAVRQQTMGSSGIINSPGTGGDRGRRKEQPVRL